MENIKIEFQPSYDDYLTVSRATAFNKPTLVLIVLMSMVSIATLFGNLFGWLNLNPDLIPLYFLLPLLFLAFLFYTPINLRKQSKMLTSRKITVIWQLTDAGIAVSEGNENFQHAWNTLGIAQEIKDYYIFYFKINRLKFIFLPKNAFSSADQESRFQQMVKQYLGEFI